MEEPGRLPSMGSQRVGHNWATSFSFFTFMHWRRKWQPTPVFLPGESQGRGSLAGCHIWDRRVRHDWGDSAAAAIGKSTKQSVSPKYFAQLRLLGKWQSLYVTKLTQQWMWMVNSMSSSSRGDGEEHLWNPRGKLFSLHHKASAPAQPLPESPSHAAPAPSPAPNLSANASFSVKPSRTTRDTETPLLYPAPLSSVSKTLYYTVIYLLCAVLSR